MIIAGMEFYIGMILAMLLLVGLVYVIFTVRRRTWQWIGAITGVILFWGAIAIAIAVSTH